MQRLEPLEDLLAFMSGSDDPILKAMLGPTPPPPPAPPAAAPSRDASTVADSMLRLVQACASAEGGIGNEDADLRRQLSDIERVLAGRPLDASGGRDAYPAHAAPDGDAEESAAGEWDGPADPPRTAASRGSASAAGDDSYDEEVAAIGTALQVG